MQALSFTLNDTPETREKKKALCKHDSRIHHHQDTTNNNIHSNIARLGQMKTKQLTITKNPTNQTYQKLNQKDQKNCKMAKKKNKEETKANGKTNHENKKINKIKRYIKK